MRDEVDEISRADFVAVFLREVHYAQREFADNGKHQIEYQSFVDQPIIQGIKIKCFSVSRIAAIILNSREPDERGD